MSDVAEALCSKGAEARLCLWAAALLSYRRASCLKPTPPSYSIDGHTDFDALIDVLHRIPALPKLVELLNDHNYVSKNQDVVELLRHIVVDLSEPSLVLVPNSSIDSILSKAPSEGDVPKPQYVFEVIGSVQSENKWKNLADGHNTFFAYHGSRLENFHSIVQHGLQQHMNKNKLFGSGTYLSSELGISLPYSQTGLSWDGSTLGQYLSCVALCELIDNPTGVISQRSKSKVQNHSKANDSLAGEIPHKYYIVSNNDFVRVKYLLMYTKYKPSGNGRTPKTGAIKKWLSQHKLLAVMLCYLFVLIVIGLGNSHSYYYFKKLYDDFGLN